MPDETKTEEVAVPVVLDSVPTELVVFRNKTDTTDGNDHKFVQAKLKKKNKADADKFALVPVKPKTPEDFQKFLAFLGVEQAALLAYQRMRGLSANWTTSSFNDKTGQFIQSDFVKCVEEMSARGETLKALNEERAELMQEIVNLGKNKQMSMPDKVKRMEEIGERMNVITETITARQASGTEDAELEGAEAPAVA